VRGLRTRLQTGDRVMVINRLSSLMGEAGVVVEHREGSRVYHVQLDGDEDGTNFYIDELEKLP
jgi:hypothetical protein